MNAETIRNEIWEDIQGYEGLYQISSYGRVKSLERKAYGFNRIVRGIILKPGKNRNYFQVRLYNESGYKVLLVHRLVALHFVENPLPEKYNYINHKDENPSNNNADNLEWCDYIYNNNYGNCNKKRSEKLLNYEKFSKPITQYDKSGNLIKTFPSARQAARELNCKPRRIYNALNGHSKSSLGYLWRHNV